MAELTTQLRVRKRKHTNQTYAVAEHKIEGYVDGPEALKQAIYKRLITEKFEYPIYSFGYGIPFAQLLGKEQAYVRAEMKRMIEDALMRDDRILEADEFSFLFEGDTCKCRFRVNSIYGNFETETEVTV